MIKTIIKGTQQQQAVILPCIACLLTTIWGGCTSKSPPLPGGSEETSNQVVLSKKFYIREMTDKVLLAKLSKGNNAEVATRMLTNQALLAAIAVEDEDRYVRVAAVEKVTDKSLLAKIAGREHGFATNAIVATATIRLGLENPIVRLRIPNAEFDIYDGSTHQLYSLHPGWPTISVEGEYIEITVTQGSRTLAEDIWETDYPKSVPESPYKLFIPAEVNSIHLMKQLFSQPEFTREDLFDLEKSPIPEVQAAALMLIVKGNELFK